MFLENFLEKKTGKKITSPNISSWRRQVCGDLTSVFRPYNGEKFPLPDFENKEVVIRNIQNAKNKPKQTLPTPLSNDEIKKINNNPSFDDSVFHLLPQQEKGIRPACILPYILYAEASVNKENNTLVLQFESRKEIGAPFNIYTPTSYKGDIGKTWSYAVSAGDVLEDVLDINQFENKEYNICIHAPNGFFRHFTGNGLDENISVICDYEQKGIFSKQLSGNVIVKIENKEEKSITVTLIDNAYGKPAQNIIISGSGKKEILIDVKKNNYWYDFTMKIEGNKIFGKRYAGHVETNEYSTSDPYMGAV
ncbi:MAG: DUF756 domain-containing protein [Arachidicoccus sp.]|nr:DUF756 domain-containing protein [Arachidicoccus sp.]